MTNTATQFDKRRDGMVILIQAAAGQGVGNVSARIETGDTVRLFLNKRAILAEVTGSCEDGYSGRVCSKDTHLPVLPGEAVCFAEIHVDAVFKRNLSQENDRAEEQLGVEDAPFTDRTSAA